MTGRVTFPEEDDDDPEALTVIDPSMGVRRVAVDPRLHDDALLASRLRGGSHGGNVGFWGRARAVFSNSVLTSPEVQALRDGGPPVPPSAAGRRLVTKLIEESTDDEGSPRMGEEKKFSSQMHEEWMRCLREEINLLREERRNEMLAEEQQVAGWKKAAGDAETSVASLPKSPWAGPGKKAAFPIPPTPTSSRPWRQTGPISPTPKSSTSPKSASAVTPTSKGVDRQQSRGKGLRHLHSLTVAHHLERNSSFPNENAREGKAKLEDILPLSEATSGTIPEQHPLPSLGSPKSSADRSLSANQVSTSEGDGGQHGAAGFRMALRNWSVRRTTSSPSGPEPNKKRYVRHSSIGEPDELMRSGQLPSLIKTTKMDRTTSGVRAAKAAAEAAATGGHRIRRVWERMKRMLGHSKAVEQTGLSSGGSSLSNRLRHGVIPPEERGHAWVALACSDVEDDLVSHSRYLFLLRQPSKSAKEIERDVNRTFPLHSKFREERGPGQKALFNVVKAYSVMDEEVGYCQGMGFVAATLLMHLGEEDAFCCLVYLLYRCGLRSVFLPNMAQLQVRLYQLSQLLMECLPRLHQHLEDLEIKPVMYAADWFLTLFARTLPMYLVFRVFDIIIAEKTTAIVFKLAIVLMQVCRHQLDSCKEMEFAMYFLRTELPAQLKSLEDYQLEELIAKALRVELPFESLLRLETEYDLLAEEAAMAAREVEAAAAASEAAAATWESNRAEMEERLLNALEAQKEAEAAAKGLKQRVEELLAEREGGPGRGEALPGREENGKLREGREDYHHSLEDMSRWRKLLSTEDLESSTSLLKAIVVLRREKTAISEVLQKAERTLAEKVRLDNHRRRAVEEETAEGLEEELGNGGEEAMSGGFRVSKAAMGYRDTRLGQLHAGQLTYGSVGAAWPREGSGGEAELREGRSEGAGVNILQRSTL